MFPYLHLWHKHVGSCSGEHKSLHTCSHFTLQAASSKFLTAAFSAPYSNVARAVMVGSKCGRSILLSTRTNPNNCASVPLPFNIYSTIILATVCPVSSFNGGLICSRLCYVWSNTSSIAFPHSYLTGIELWQKHF